MSIPRQIFSTTNTLVLYSDDPSCAEHPCERSLRRKREARRGQRSLLVGKPSEHLHPCSHAPAMQDDDATTWRRNCDCTTRPAFAELLRLMTTTRAVWWEKQGHLCAHAAAVCGHDDLQSVVLSWLLAWEMRWVRQDRVRTAGMVRQPAVVSSFAVEVSPTRAREQSEGALAALHHLGLLDTSLRTSLDLWTT